MAGNVSLNTVTDGLVLYLDAANTKSLADVPSRNLILQSQNFSSSSWAKINLIVTSGIIAPNGTTTANNLANTTSTYLRCNQSFTGLISGTVFTYSCYIKKENFQYASVLFGDTGEVTNNWVQYDFDLNVVTQSNDLPYGVISKSCVFISNGWYRLSFTFSIPSSYTNVKISGPGASTGYNTAISGNSLNVWGAQLELGSVATTYIPTTTAAASRIPTWTDISRGGNNGTLTNGLTYNYSNGGSLVFNGATSFITIPNPINQSNLLQEWTVMAWINISDKTSQTLLGGLNMGLYVCYSQGNNSLLYLNNTYGGDYYTYGGDLGGIGWVLVTFIFKNLTGERYIYRNGVNITTTGPNVSSNPLGISPTLVIGQISTGNLTSGFQGLLSNIQIYNRALSSQEVLQNYNTTKSKYGL